MNARTRTVSVALKSRMLQSPSMAVEDDGSQVFSASRASVSVSRRMIACRLEGESCGVPVWRSADVRCPTAQIALAWSENGRAVKLLQYHEFPLRYAVPSCVREFGPRRHWNALDDALRT